MNAISKHVDGAEHELYAGKLTLVNANGALTENCCEISFGRDIIIGRSSSSCNWAFEDDPYVSNKHLRIFVTKCDAEAQSTQLLVYAEDLSRHGSFWNNSLFKKGRDVVVLSDNDHLRLSSQTTLRFMVGSPDVEHFDMKQEREMQTFSDQFVLTDQMANAKFRTRTFIAVKRATRAHLACRVVSLADLENDDGRTVQISPRPSLKQYQNDSTNVGSNTPAAKNRRLQDEVASCVHEAQMTNLLKHPNILSVEKLFASDHNLYIFHQLSTHNDVLAFLKHRQGTLLEAEVALILYQLLQAVKFLHMEHAIAHCNIRPESVLLSRRWTGNMVVLSGFEQAIAASSTPPRPAMIPNQYTAPELFVTPEKELSVSSLQQADMWSLGAVGVVLAMGDVTTSGRSLDNVHDIAQFWTDKVTALMPVWLQRNVESWSSVKDFSASLLLPVSGQRPSAEQQLNHFWLAQVSSLGDLESAYSKLVQHWSQPMSRDPIVELIAGKSSLIKGHPCIKSTFQNPKRRRGSSQRPAEPPYKPFPRKMYLRGLWPARVNEASQLSTEVKRAIRERWSTKMSSEQSLRGDQSNRDEVSNEIGRLPSLTGQLSMDNSLSRLIIPRLKTSSTCIDSGLHVDHAIAPAQDFPSSTSHNNISSGRRSTADPASVQDVRPKLSLRRRSEQRQPLTSIKNQHSRSMFDIPADHELHKLSEGNSEE